MNRPQSSEVWSIEYLDQEGGWSVHGRAYTALAARTALIEFRERMPHVKFRVVYSKHEEIPLGW